MAEHDFIAKCVGAELGDGQRFTSIEFDRYECVTIGQYYYVRAITPDEYRAAMEKMANGPEEMTFADALGFAKERSE